MGRGWACFCFFSFDFGVIFLSLFFLHTPDTLGRFSHLLQFSDIASHFSLRIYNV